MAHWGRYAQPQHLTPLWTRSNTWRDLSRAHRVHTNRIKKGGKFWTTSVITHWPSNAPPPRCFVPPPYLDINMRQSAITWFPEGFPPPSKWYWIKVVWVNQPNVYLPTTAINLLHSDVLGDDWDYDFFKEVSVHRNIPTWLLNISGEKKKTQAEIFSLIFFYYYKRRNITPWDKLNTPDFFLPHFTYSTAVSVYMSIAQVKSGLRLFIEAWFQINAWHTIIYPLPRASQAFFQSGTI